MAVSVLPTRSLAPFPPHAHGNDDPYYCCASRQREIRKPPKCVRAWENPMQHRSWAFPCCVIDEQDCVEGAPEHQGPEDEEDRPGQGLYDGSARSLFRVVRHSTTLARPGVSRLLDPILFLTVERRG
jgi:hypothetical protein